MDESKVKYKKVDSLVHGEVKEIRLIGEDQENKTKCLISFFGLIIIMNIAPHMLVIKNFLIGLK